MLICSRWVKNLSRSVLMKFKIEFNKNFITKKLQVTELQSHDKSCMCGIKKT